MNDNVGARIGKDDDISLKTKLLLYGLPPEVRQYNDTVGSGKHITIDGAKATVYRRLCVEGVKMQNRLPAKQLSNDEERQFAEHGRRLAQVNMYRPIPANNGEKDEERPDGVEEFDWERPVYMRLYQTHIILFPHPALLIQCDDF
jgi:hypothetical protein